MTEVYLVQLDSFDEMYVFAHQDQADQFAALYRDCLTGTAEVLGRGEAAALIRQELGLPPPCGHIISLGPGVRGFLTCSLPLGHPGEHWSERQR